ITNDSVSFTLDLYIENLLDDTLTPRISSRHLKTNVYLTDTNSFLIGGINSKETIKSTKTIPFIENIPILGDITTYKSEKTNDYSFSIFITMLPSEKDIFSEFYYDPADKHIALERYLTSAARNAKGAPRSGE
ncbi:ABC transporter ATP-binding protein, partial [Campylobacter concisus]